MLELKKKKRKKSVLGPERKDATLYKDNHPRSLGVPQFWEISPKVVSIKVSINMIRQGWYARWPLGDDNLRGVASVQPSLDFL